MRSANANFKYRIALAGAERASALELIHRSYLIEFGHVPDDGADAGAFFLCAYADRDQIAGVLRLLPPAVRPFDCEKFVDLKDAVPDPQKVGLLGRFSLSPEFRRLRRTEPVHLGLLRFAVSVAEKNGITTLILYAPLKFARIYRSVGFISTGLHFFHPVASCEMEILRFEIAGQGSTIRSAKGGIDPRIRRTLPEPN